MTLYFASHNPNKVAEIRRILPVGLELKGLDELGLNEEIPETAETIEGNSLMKTQYVWDRYHVPCFGDDTGLEVDALGGAPGVYSARYAGPEKDSEANMKLLLKNLVNCQSRDARFKTVITYIDAEGMVHQFTGVVNGVITAGRSGAEGFGYDPVFRPEGYKQTFAEMSRDEKNVISHRGRAFAQLVTFLNQS